jgi:hypothetical protein
VIALLLALAAQNPWHGYGEGSTIELKTTTTVDGKAEPAATKKLVRVKEERWSLEGAEITQLEGWTPASASLEKTSSESAVRRLGIAEVECLLEKWKGGKDNRKLEVTLWMAKEKRAPSRDFPLPGPDASIEQGILAWETTIDTGGKTVKASSRIVGHEKRTVGKVEILCFVEEISLETDDTLAKGKRWLSADVPGHVVVSDVTGTSNGREMTQVVEVVAFEVKK